MKARFDILLLLFTAVLTGAGFSCGESAATLTGSENGWPDAETAAVLTPAEAPPQSRTALEIPTAPVMPNIDPADAEAADRAALAAYETQFGDGSGAEVVWGPNIVEGWAIAGLANSSGAGNKKVLLYKEGNDWVVKDMGDELSVQWKDKTPSALWP